MNKVIGMPLPPGGKLVCESGQTAIIKHNKQTNEIIAQCVTDIPPKAPVLTGGLPSMFPNIGNTNHENLIADNPANFNNLLSNIYGIERADTDGISAKEKTMLLDGYGVIRDLKTNAEIEIFISPPNSDTNYVAREEINKIISGSIFNLLKDEDDNYQPQDFQIHPTKSPPTAAPYGIAGPIIMELPDSFMKPEIQLSTKKTNFEN